MTATATDQAPPAAPIFSDGYKRVVVGFLLAAYTFNFIDRTIVATIGQAIKVDLKITDSQLGLLGGIAFAILYTVLGVPIARLAERRSRVTIISASLIVWSGFTMACGFAANFVSLLIMRVGVGIGEAGCSPPSHSLISDYFAPTRRASALGIYALGIPIGAMIGSVAGGWLAKTYGWRVAFMVVGAPGVILAILIKLIVREPPRGHSDADAAPAAVAPAGGLTGELSEIWAVARTLFGSWPVLNMVLGVTIVSIAGYGIGQFALPYFNRAFGLDYATVGLIFGLLGGVSTGLGTLAGGFISDRASRHGARWYALTPAIGLAIATPLYVLAYRASDWRTAALLLFIPGMLTYTYLAPTFGVVQNVVETRRRATATAVMFLFLNIIALGGGPFLAGVLIDHFAQFDFNHLQPTGFFQRFLGAVGGGHGAGASFVGQCPGGVPPPGASAGLAARCKVTEALATREGILVMIGFYAWGSLHYLLASFGLAARMAKANAARAAGAL